MEKVYVRKVSTTDKRFKNRHIWIVSGSEIDLIPVDDEVVVCNGCNDNLFPGDGYLVYLSKEDLKLDRPYDLYCFECLYQFFKHSEVIEV